MASAVYPSAKASFLGADIDLLVDDIRAILVNTTGAGTLYTYSSAHDFLNDVSAGARIGVSGNLAGKTTTAGVFDATDTSVTSVSGDIVEAVILYKHTGTESTSNLICYIDTFSAGVPLTPDGGNVLIAWDNGANKIFSI